MDMTRIRTLSDAGRFDLCSSCTTPGYRQKYTEDALTQAALGGIYHAHVTDGTTVPIFKTLMSNMCTHDCSYCQNSTFCKKPQRKDVYRPEELAKVFRHLYINNKVQGLFLSSGIVKDADTTTRSMIDAVRIIRKKQKFRGYIHFKALPGVSRDLLKEAKEYAQRISINIEAASESYLSEISTVKMFKSDILKRQLWIQKLQPGAGQTTQMVIGCAGETDWDVLKMMKWEYDNLDLRRMYYSAFSPLKHTPFDNKTATPVWRSRRLYNVDWLYRVYKYQFSEIKELLVDGMLPDKDPKETHARIFLDDPVDVDAASYDELLRVPGIGPKTARRLISIQGKRRLKRRDLQKAGAVLKRADPFLKVNGWRQERLCTI